MADVQERVATLEGRVEGYAAMTTDIAGAVRHLEARMDQHFTEVGNRFLGIEHRLTALDQKSDLRLGAFEQKVDGKLGALEQRMDTRLGALKQEMDARTGALEQKIAAVDLKIDGVETRLDQKLDSHFRWLVGIQFAMFVTLVASLMVLAG